ncbi:MAG: hypothetical protein NC213_09935 [Acetobacter sp.]|nr:hypothetical protein [Bacteroides sp.]MCM1342052.1 hypothetical protein [Acetobacter sp.]MCM1434262.1 hypothetical protein [Clostridiales bacterium]
MKNITLEEAITYFDEQCPNQYTREDKIGWISELDEQIYEEIIKPRMNPPVTEFNGYDENTDNDTTLLVPSVFKEIYRYWLEKSVDFNNREIGAFNNAMLMYQTYYDNYFAWYNRNHRFATKQHFII